MNSDVSSTQEYQLSSSRTPNPPWLYGSLSGALPEHDEPATTSLFYPDTTQATPMRTYAASPRFKGATAGNIG